MDEARIIEKAAHISKLTLCEVFPLYPFLQGRQDLQVMDVGGNTGLWCEAFQGVFGHRLNSYRAFEPMPGNVARFNDRKALNEWDNVKVIQQCLGDSIGEVTIHYDREVTTLASVVVADMKWNNVQISNSNQLEVEQRTLDDVLGNNHLDLIKIDTEGYEWNVLQGGLESLRSGRVDNVYFEFGGHQQHLGQSFKQFWDFFHDMGWRVFRQTTGRNYFGLNEWRRYTELMEDFSTMNMILASRLGPSPDYRGPRVVGQIN